MQNQAALFSLAILKCNLVKVTGGFLYPEIIETGNYSSHFRRRGDVCSCEKLLQTVVLQINIGNLYCSLYYIGHAQGL